MIELKNSQTGRYALRLVALGAVLFAMPTRGNELSEASEWRQYQQSATRCEGAHAMRAAEVGVSRYYAWKRAVDAGRAPPEGAFRDAGQAFEYLYVELGCRDPLVAYRYGNLLRHRKQFGQAIEVMRSALAGLRERYPAHVVHALSALGQAATRLGRTDDAIGYYRGALDIDPDDVGTRLNLAKRLYYRQDYTEARRQAQEAIRSGLSPYGRRKADELLRKLDERTASTGG